MIPKLNRGHSFIALTKYLTHDKREAGQADADSAERVGFCHTANFAAGQAADDPENAARLMALTWLAREQLKQAAGIKPGGSVSKGPPVWHTSLSWAQGEAPDQAEKMRAAEAYLSHLGLGKEAGYQTIIVEHTDTAHPHVHIVVNLVHPDTGKQADPFRDQQRAQAWARAYEKQRGEVFCHAREEKHAAADRKRSSHASPNRAAFNSKGQGETGRATGKADSARTEGRAGGARASRDRPARSVPYNVWQAQQQARNAAEQAAASQIKADLGGRYRDMRTRHEAAWQARRQEQAQARADAQGSRNAIYEKYASALDAIYHPPAGPKKAAPERSAWVAVHQHLADRRATFDRREDSAWGRFQNARSLMPGASLLRTVRLAIYPAERRRLFERQQRTTQSNLMPRGAARTKERPQPKTPDLPHRRAANVRAMRTAELADHARRQAAGAASMAARHAFQQAAEQGERDQFKAESKAAWQAHRQAFAAETKAKEQDNGRTAGVGRKTAAPRPAAPEQDHAAASAEAATPAPERKADRFGRSRDRKPRQPRAGRGQGEQSRGDQQGGDSQQGSANRQTAEKGPAEAEKRPVEAGPVFGDDHIPAMPEATHAAPTEQHDPAVVAYPWQPGEREAAKEAERVRQDAQRGQERDTGRTLSR